MNVRIVSFEGPGLVVKARFGGQFTIAYGEILTAERLLSFRGLRLHTKAMGSVRVPCGRGARSLLEGELRCRGVRVVDSWGAIVAPTLSDFQYELARGPDSLRQSSDNG